MRKGELLFIRLLFLTVFTFGAIDAFAQSRTITGTIHDENNEPLIGANILIEGTTNGTIADFDGKYHLEVPEGTNNIVVSFVGYLSQTIAIGTRSVIDVVLEADAEQLEEVIVVGYGTQEKVNVTGSVAQVDSEVLSAVPTPDAIGALQGRIAGVTVNPGQGPGATPTIRVRGVTSMSGSNDPLIVIDGIPSTVENFATLANSDIETISVLKDAASASIYGARAAAGVILVTTKRGKTGEPTVTYDGYVAMQSMTTTPNYMNSLQYMEAVNRGFTAQGGNEFYTEQHFETVRNGGDHLMGQFDWWDAVYRDNAPQQSHYVNVTGGTEKTKYLASVGYMDQQGFYQTENYFKRYNTRLNITTELSKRLKATAQMNFTRQEQQDTGDSWRATQALAMVPLNPIYNQDGTYNITRPVDNTRFENTLAHMKLSDYIRKVNQLQSFLSLDYEIAKNLTVTGRTSMNFRSFEQNHFQQGYQFVHSHNNAVGLNLQSAAAEDWNNSMRVVNDLVMNYHVDFGKHHIGALVGIAEEFFRYDRLYGRRVNFANNQLRKIIAGGQAGQIAESNAYDWALQSQFARINYDYDKKYLLEVNVRRDVSSRFHKDNRAGVFPSVSVGWRIAEEDFFKDNVSENFISDIKFRGSVGSLGNQNINNSAVSNLYYPYMGVISAADYPYNNELVMGKAQNEMPVPGLKWETTVTYNAGIDIDFLDGKLGTSFDYFKKITSDMLLPLPMSAVGGLGNPWENAATLENTGWEFDIRYSNTTKSGFTYGIGANISHFTNVLTDLAGGFSEYSNQFREGDPIGTIYGYRTKGIYRDQAHVDADNAKLADASLKNGVAQTRNVMLGDLIYEDINGDGIINHEDMVAIGNTLPKYQFGITFDFAYKNFDLSMFWQGAADIDGYVGYNVFAGNKDSNLRDFYTDAYHPDLNPNGAYPRFSPDENSQNHEVNDFWVQSASYLRLKNLQIGYSLPKTVTDQMKIGKARVYLSGQNLLTITNFDEGFDPEMVAPMNQDGSFQVGDVRPSFMPTVRVVSAGLQVTF
ncbi:TonB-dependent receptor [Flammeovirga sp. MY04]|uniref:SusC/RagA family TonB-linked outer membrane protein n=1 Tax=Flammeovirga sp. MY04 TaxID=1191459 RepID=UPI00080617F2|nr:TonB-dependent receptor [Flammeovirga sp. MY04]ANQ51957.1 TonB-dependent receptor [Flammeovirga sp. MY04]